MKRFIQSMIIVICGISINSYSFAETRAECEDKMMPSSTLAKGAGLGTVAGTATGAAACSMFLGAVFVDFGLSYAACLATVTAVGTVAGTTIAETRNIEERKRCRKLSN